MFNFNFNMTKTLQTLKTYFSTTDNNWVQQQLNQLDDEIKDLVLQTKIEVHNLYVKPKKTITKNGNKTNKRKKH